MKSSGLIAIALFCLFSGSTVHAQQSAAPAGSTGQCKDDSYTSTASKKGACRGHKGVQTWYAASGAAASAPAAAPAAPAPTAAAPATTTTAAPAPKKTAATPSATAAPGGGPGLVWVNTPTHVYHCSTDKWYGKTKTGSYMTEAAAKAEGDHADHGKACQ